MESSTTAKVQLNCSRDPSPWRQRVRRATLVLGLSTAACVAWTSIAFADASPVPSAAAAAPSLTYAAPPDCPDRDEFVRRVESRTRSGSLAPADPSSVARLDVALREVPEHVTAELVVTDDRGVAASRRIDAPTCSEAVDGIALIAAVTLDPAARPAATTPPVPEPVAPEPPPSPPRSREPSRVRLRVSAAPTLSSAPSPSVRVGAEGAVSALFELGKPWGLLSWVGARFGASVGDTTDEGRATFQSWALVAALCPVYEHRAFVVQACATVEEGRVSATGSDTAVPKHADRPWTAVGPGASVEWAVMPPLSFAVDAEALFPLVRDHFLLGSEAVYRVPAVAPRAGVRVILRFW